LHFSGGWATSGMKFGSDESPARCAETDGQAGRWRLWIFGLLAVATGAKLYWAATSVGSGDVLLFYDFAHSLQRFTLAQFYTLEPLFNHTPLTGVCLRALFAACNRGGGTPLENLETFAFWLRAAGILADMGVVFMLLRVQSIANRPGWWALAGFAISPISLMISGFHGNIDPILVAALTASALACLQSKPILAGVLFGLACNVKVVPLPFAPVFFFYWWPRRRAWHFSGGVLAMLVLGFGPLLLQAPSALLHNVLGYSSSWGSWGITFFLKKTGWKAVQHFAFQGLSPEQIRIATVLKALMIGGIATLGWRRRGVDGIEFFSTLARAWAIFFVFAPGIGLQYLVWCAPFVLLCSPRWWAAITASGTVMLATFYQTTAKGHFPWILANPQSPETPLVDPWSVVVWLVFVAFLIAEFPKILPGRTANYDGADRSGRSGEAAL
jgi:Glycosyltransferase family 87